MIIWSGKKEEVDKKGEDNNGKEKIIERVGDRVKFNDLVQVSLDDRDDGEEKEKDEDEEIGVKTRSRTKPINDTSVNYNEEGFTFISDN